jgi:acetyl-CoA carboxylase biotin carboxyl carrier protein
MDLRKLKTLIDLVSESGISELEVTEGEGKVRIVKNAPAAAPIYMQQPHQPAYAYASAPAVPATVAPASAAVSGADEYSGQHLIKSPMVGTFYRAPGLDKDPFVQVGDTVTEGQILCIIEAMKLMNDIQSDKSGKILKILIENGHSVEYGQPLFVIG